jgi:hypothetical protein
MKSRIFFHFIFLIFLIFLTLFTPPIVTNKIGTINEDSSPFIKTSGIIRRFECYNPQICVDFENNVHTIWTFSEGPILEYIKKPVNSTSWSDIKTLYTPIESGFRYVGFVVDKKENLHLVWRESSEYGIVLYRCWNASKNKWNPIEIISDFIEPRSDEPIFLVDDSLNVHVVWSDWSNFSGEMYEPNLLYRCRNNNHESCQPIEILTLETNASSRINPTMTFDNDLNIVVAWIENTKLVFKLRYNNNGSWTNSSIISGSNCKHPSIACDTANNIHFTWTDWSEVHYAKYIRNTKQISHRKVFEGSQVNNPTMVLDQYENVHIAWEWRLGDDIDIWYRYKNAASETWSNTEIVSKESTSHSVNPSISVGTNDILHFVWSDATDYNQADYDFDIFYQSKNLTSGEWSTTIVLTSGIKHDTAVQHFISTLVFYILLGSSLVILIIIPAIIIIRKRKNIINK